GRPAKVMPRAAQSGDAGRGDRSDNRRNRLSAPGQRHATLPCRCQLDPTARLLAHIMIRPWSLRPSGLPAADPEPRDETHEGSARLAKSVCLPEEIGMPAGTYKNLPLAERLLESFDASGLHPGFRPAHAKGLMCC